MEPGFFIRRDQSMNEGLIPILIEGETEFLILKLHIFLTLKNKIIIIKKIENQGGPYPP